jgi:hypothetical protein
MQIRIYRKFATYLTTFLKREISCFPVDGDSMPPHKKGSFIVGQYVERLGDVMDGKRIS